MDWSAIPSLSALRAFDMVARTGSYTAAGRDLNVTHAAIAQHVRTLEGTFQTSLVTRRGRGMSLTPAGQLLADHLQKGFGQIATGVEALQAYGTTRPLSVTVTPSFAANWLIPRMADFWQTHPDITVQLVPAIQVMDLQHNNFDLALRYGTGDWPGVKSRLLTGGDFWVVCHPDLLPNGPPPQLQDIPDGRWILEPYMLELRRVLENAGIILHEDNVTLLETNELVLSASLSGHGFSVHPKSLVERDVDAGRLTKVHALSQPPLGYYMVTRADNQSPALKTFTSWLLDTTKET
ncbi:LysR family glycine cleavage system transcriptional activator [Shimia isoporae]|uniref:LysR family glycine cleavage system transcriptional activator n=1 Tax=Shimia isoporae TaxID=647720 RepID=A0A4R1NYF8_9RHOB|nr:LysR family transcriptional regulator [Shimia isoporae]TCL10252.1 LysR family glycine cleavage system transcriptional activator [Shimia isoporae]